MPRDRFPVVHLRPFVVYRPPGPQALRLASPREAYADVRTFIERCARLVRAERIVQLSIERERAPACDVCSDAELRRIVRLATNRFGEPPESRESVYPESPGRAYWAWSLPSGRVYDVLDFLDDPATAPCTHARVNASVNWTFFLRDVESRKVLPYQERKFRPGWPVISWLMLTLQSRSEVQPFLVFPFEPNEMLRHYILALQAEAPVRFDPAYFDHFVPRDGSRDFERRRLPREWLISGDLGELAADTPSSPPSGNAESAAAGVRTGASGESSHPLSSVISEIGTALRTHRYGSVVVSGDWLVVQEIIERAAGPFGLGVVQIDCGLLHEEGAESAVADALRDLAGERGVIVFARLDRAGERLRLAFETLMSTRSLGAITLPPEVRLAATQHVRSNPVTQASRALWHRARAEGFLTEAALDAAGNDLDRRLYAEVSISFVERQVV